MDLIELQGKKVIPNINSPFTFKSNSLTFHCIVTKPPYTRWILDGIKTYLESDDPPLKFKDVIYFFIEYDGVFKKPKILGTAYIETETKEKIEKINPKKAADLIKWDLLMPFHLIN